MSGQTPSLESTLEPETVSNDTTLLPSGPRYSKDPKDKPATQKGHVSPRPKVSEDTSTTNQGNITNNLGMTTHDRKGPMHAKGNAQKGNKTNPVDNTLRLPKKGKNEVHAASGSQSLNNMQAYESKENYTMELGFATHTPKETHSHYPRSPNKSHTGQSNSCRFYVRKSNNNPWMTSYAEEFWAPNNTTTQPITPLDSSHIHGNESPHRKTRDQEQAIHHNSS
ncbi:hypothetical protein JHK85_055833 [Glycine max]|nr:hypothetical protein JHK85_055833 [Glycine max]